MAASNNLTEGVLADVEYTKLSSGEEEVTERVIIPSFVPQPKHRNVKALDVTDLSDEERAQLQHWMQEYRDYVQFNIESLKTFEEFVDYRYNLHVSDLKWRTFKPDQLKQL